MQTRKRSASSQDSPGRPAGPSGKADYSLQERPIGQERPSGQTRPVHDSLVHDSLADDFHLAPPLSPAQPFADYQGTKAKQAAPVPRAQDDDLGFARSAGGKTPPVMPAPPRTNPMAEWARRLERPHKHKQRATALQGESSVSPPTTEAKRTDTAEEPAMVPPLAPPAPEPKTDTLFGGPDEASVWTLKAPVKDSPVSQSPETGKATRTEPTETAAAPKPQQKAQSQDGAKTQPGTTPSPADIPLPDPFTFARNLGAVAYQAQSLLRDVLVQQQEPSRRANTDPFNISGPFTDFMGQMMGDPVRLVRSQMDLWQAQAGLWQSMWSRALGHPTEPVVEPEPGDKRWKNPEWSENAVFDFIKQSYLITSKWMVDTVSQADGFEPHAKDQLTFFTKQITDALSPANFALTNPEVIRETMRTNGENLVKGFSNLMDDMDRGNGLPWIRHTDLGSFQVGGNIAATPGSVVYENELMQLIQYNPSTDEVHERPLLIVPPWINKYYILDLREENSFVKWAVDQGHTVFVVSWANPDTGLSGCTFEDYLRLGVLDALNAITEATGARQVNAIGYCIGGTLLSAALAWLAARNRDPIASATFFATQVDFSEAGELSVFIDENQIRAIDEQVKTEGGCLEGVHLATIFNMLRANDLIWSFVVNNYLLGRDPRRFDLLYWNADQTRLPRAMLLTYLRDCYLDNRLAKGEMTLLNERIDLSKVRVPIYIQCSKDDHIAPSRSVYKGRSAFGGPVRFVCAGSGHIAGVINPPQAQKYQYWTSDGDAADFDTWLENADCTPGSWWPDWKAWMSNHSGPMVPARIPGEGVLDVIEPAPGSYVRVRSAW